ncbi:MAG: hypothetical protein JO250_22210 [Armatimonadetes bacterium]|nr:hypothetical protein [Armatimonadota bacterium]
MNIVLPIVFAAVLVGLFARRVTIGHWVGLAAWIVLVIAYNFVKAH